MLELDPNFVDAKLVVGTHNYVIGHLPWSVKVAAALAGLSGSSEKGLAYLRDAARSDGAVCEGDRFCGHQPGEDRHRRQRSDECAGYGIAGRPRE